MVSFLLMPLREQELATLHPEILEVGRRGRRSGQAVRPAEL